MDDKRFWDIIHAACLPGASEAEWYEGLERELGRLAPEDLVRFDHWVLQKTRAADCSDLSAAYNTLGLGGSDDGFHYFCCWLVGMGKQVYESALTDADTLADVRPRGLAESAIYGFGRRVWSNEFGRTDEDYDEMANKLRFPPITRPKAEGWDIRDEAEFRRRLPRLAALYFGDSDAQ